MGFSLAALGTIGSLALQGIGYGLNAANNKQMRDASAQESARRLSWTQAMAVRNPFQSAANRAILAEFDRNGDKQRQIAQNKATVMGLLPEYTLGVEKAYAEGRAQLGTGIAKEAAANEEKYLLAGEQARQDQFSQEQAYAQQRSNNISNAVSNVASATPELINSVGGATGKKNAPAGSAAHTSAAQNATGQAAFSWTNKQPDMTNDFWKQKRYNPANYVTA